MGIKLDDAVIYPDNLAFAQMKADHGDKRIPITLTTKIPKGLSPADAAAMLCPRGEICLLLESVRQSKDLGRFSILGLNPFKEFRSKGRHISIREARNTPDDHGERALDPRPNAPFGQAPGERVEDVHDPFTRLEEELAKYPVHTWPGLPKFAGGIIGSVAYDMGRFFEHLPDQTVDDLQLPELCFYWVDEVIVFDHIEETLTLLSHARKFGPKPAVTEEAGQEEYRHVVRRLTDLARSLPSAAGKSKCPLDTTERAYQGTLQVTTNVSPEQFEDMVLRCKEYILAGDIFQANLSVRSGVTVESHPWELYRVLRQINPSPYGCYLDFGDWQVVSSSPELLVRLQGNMAETRPIAGTRKRGQTPEEDAAMAAELASNEKESAEHIMLVDLERNDLGRVCEYGSVHVNELKVIEYYSHVMHLVSNVRGKLIPGKNAFDLVRASFPGGTITGAPKIRSMEIIEELEPTKRALYTGSVGFIGYDGSMELNIVIRTLLIKDGRAYVQAGAGIVADSIPRREYKESLRKAEALLRAVEIAESSRKGNA